MPALPRLLLRGPPAPAVPGAPDLLAAEGHRQAVVSVELGNSIHGLRTIPGLPVETDENAVRHHGRLHASIEHLFEKAQASCQVTNLDTTVQQCVVDELVPPEPPFANPLEDLESLVDLPSVAVAFEKCGE